ncbi:hypothetical protein [Arthrobacter sp. Soil736]|uniref:hypothetical protein n=1 Tax=Arthrobacter sp. Soil736 TaxID=1736395 RepID=UPI0012FC05FB|nr:hypothetical protein [Arthrobacter sp. Soil736]
MVSETDSEPQVCRTGLAGFGHRRDRGRRRRCAGGRVNGALLASDGDWSAL